MTEITLFRDHPSEGWHSMERYADGLELGLREARPHWALRPLTPPAPWRGSRGRLLARAARYPQWARAHQGALNHVLDHSYGHLLFALDPRRTVVTIHDLAPLHFPGARLGLSGLLWRLALRGARRAARLLADSEFTRRAVIERFDVAAERITTVPLAHHPRFRPLPERARSPWRARFNPGGAPLLLHTGSLEPRKNFETLLRALALLGGLRPLLLQAGGAPSPAQLAQCEASGLAGQVRFLGSVSDETLTALYNLADVFVFPSLYEGFGLPPLEAMACGAPVAAADAASLPEVVGSAGLLLPPTDPAAWAAAIAGIFARPPLAAELRANGLAQAAKFSWLETACQTAHVYEALQP
jgi:glycosyltransferase involved in cell wall biosynthesis